MPLQALRTHLPPTVNTPSVGPALAGPAAPHEGVPPAAGGQVQHALGQGALAGQAVAIRPASGSPLQQLRDEAAARPKPTTLQKVWSACSAKNLGKAFLGVVGGAVALPFAVLGLTLVGIGAVVAGGAKGAGLAAGGGRAPAAAGGPPQPLAEAMAGGILDRPFAGAGSASGKISVGAMMEDYRTRLDSPVSASDMKAYINQGERILAALEDQPYSGGELTVLDNQGQPQTIQPGLEATRAVSWFLQAKAMQDNAGHGADPALIKRGSMVAADPDGKLFKFLNAAPTAYGRASSHFNERSASASANFSNAGVGGQLAGKGQTAHRGIEDYDNRMPSDRGCLVFDKMRGQDGQAQIYLKWEPVGMPDVLSGRATEAGEGKARAVVNRADAYLRSVGHCFNFAHTLLESKASANWGVRREAVAQGQPKVLLDEFTALAKEVGLSPADAKAAASSARKNGVHLMDAVLTAWTADLKGMPGQQATLARALQLQGALKEFAQEQGADLGVERKGAEIHVSLSMSHLRDGPALDAVDDAAAAAAAELAAAAAADAATAPPAATFDAARANLEGLLQKDSYPRFVKSPAAQGLDLSGGFPAVMAQTAQGGPLIAAFAGFLEKEHSSENLDAIRAFDDFKAAPLASKAQAVWSTFIESDAPSMVNLTGAEVSGIKTALGRA